MVRRLLVTLVSIASAAFSLAAQSSGTPDDLMGGFQSSSGAIIKIVAEGDRLFTVPASGPRQELVPKTGTVYVTNPGGETVTFTREGNGRVSHIIVGEAEKWTRIVVQPSTLATYVGTYPLSPKLSMTVTLEGDRLIAQATGASKHPLHPLSQTRFFVQDSASADSAEMEFGGGEQGMPFVIFHQSGSQQKVMRQ